RLHTQIANEGCPLVRKLVDSAVLRDEEPAIAAGKMRADMKDRAALGENGVRRAARERAIRCNGGEEEKDEHSRTRHAHEWTSTKRFADCFRIKRVQESLTRVVSI